MAIQNDSEKSNGKNDRRFPSGMTNQEADSLRQ